MGGWVRQFSQVNEAIKYLQGKVYGITPESSLTGLEQVDIPHFTDWLVKDHRPPFLKCHDDPATGNTVCTNERCDEFVSTCANEVIIGQPPTPLTSGAHRILMNGRCDGVACSVAVEEIEDNLCEYLGEKVYIGIDDETAKRGLEIAGKPFQLFILRSMIRNTTGIPLEIDTELRGAEAGRDRIEFQLRGIDELRREGTTLSPEASQCIFIPLFDIAEILFQVSIRWASMDEIIEKGIERFLGKR